jgi:hypothetical protein
MISPDYAAYERAGEFEGFIIYAAKCVEEVLNTKIKLTREPFHQGLAGIGLRSWYGGVVSLCQFKTDIIFQLSHHDKEINVDPMVKVTLVNYGSFILYKYADHKPIIDELRQWFRTAYVQSAK